MKLYLWLCIVCILLASLPLPLPSSSLILFACLSLCGFPCVSVSSAFRLPRVLSHCLCVQLPSAIRRMLTLTLPNALQPLPPFLPPLTSPRTSCLVLRKCLAKKKRKNVPRCILLRGISNIPHVAAQFFFQCFVWFGVFFLWLLCCSWKRAKTKIFSECAANM